MFLIKYKLGHSNIHGIGIFANEDIAKGTRIYKHSSKLDLQITKRQFDKLKSEEQRIIKHYGYIDKNSGLYRLDYDDIRFINHSDNPNIGLKNGIIIALKDINKGEELIQNYKEFSEDFLLFK